MDKLSPIASDTKSPVVRVSARASRHIAQLLAAKPDAIGMRLRLVKGGCAGMEYKMEYVDTPPENEECISTQGGRLFIAPDSLLFLFGTQMDYETGKLASGFVFHNPNQTDACGCGESVTLAPSKVTKTAPAHGH